MLSYFKSGVTYMDGGMESGFRSAAAGSKAPTRMFHLKGARNVRATQVQVSRESMNEGDVFVVTTENVLYQFNGSGSSKQERAKALELTVRLRDHDGGKATIVVIDAKNSQHATDEQIEAFWGLVGGRGPIKSADEAGDDHAHETEAHGDLALYRASDASGSFVCERVAGAPLARSMLDSNDAFILDTGAEVFVWVGRNATKQERAKAMEHANQFVANAGRPSWTPITRQVERGETPDFKDKFPDWNAAESVPQRAQGGSRIAKSQASNVDASALHARAVQEEARVDDGSGVLEIWRIEDFNLVPVDTALHGHFYQGDCYVCRYTYNKGKDQLIYFWQGRDSTNDERGASALLAKKLDDDFGGQATQVRVVQGKEPNHFRRLFAGRMIIHMGGKASGFANVNDADQYDTDGISLFQVRGVSADSIVAVQVPELATSLNSNDVFVLETPKTQFMWIGRGSSAEEQSYAERISAALSKRTRATFTVEEGDEDDAFWEFIGGRAEYASEPHLANAAVEPRLFWISNASGRVQAEEVFNFSQDDLLNEDVFILDIQSEVYVWIGAEANDEEKAHGAKIAVEYVNSATDGRDKEQPILVIHAGHEPRIFTSFFHAWSPERAAKLAAGGAYEDKFANVNAGLGRVVGSSAGASASAGPAGASSSGGGSGGGMTRQRSVSNVVTDNGFRRTGSKVMATRTGPPPVVDARSLVAPKETPITSFHPYSVLVERPLPAGVDPARAEMYMTDDEFASVMGMPKAAFTALPMWKKIDIRKKKNLF